MSDRNPGISRYRDCGADSWDHFEIDSSSGQCLRLFSASSKNKWIAALEPHDVLSGTSPLDDEVIDFGLSQRMAACLFPRGNDFCIRRSPFQDFRIAEVIIDNHIRMFDRLLRPQSHQPKVPRTGPGQNAFTFFRHKSSKTKFGQPLRPNQNYQLPIPCAPYLPQKQ